jgi:hypothetical protein
MTFIFWVQLFLFSFFLKFGNQSLTSLSVVTSVSSSVFSHGSSFGSGFFFAGHFRFFYGGCTDLKDCTRELCGSVANGC